MARKEFTSTKSFLVTENATLARNLTISTTKNCSYPQCRSRDKKASTMDQTLGLTATTPSKNAPTHCHLQVMSTKACLSVRTWPCSQSQARRAWTTPPSTSVRASTMPSSPKCNHCSLTGPTTIQTSSPVSVTIVASCNSRLHIKKFTTARARHSNLGARMSAISTVWKVSLVLEARASAVEEAAARRRPRQAMTWLERALLSRCRDLVAIRSSIIRTARYKACFRLEEILWAAQRITITIVVLVKISLECEANHKIHNSNGRVLQRWRTIRTFNHWASTQIWILSFSTQRKTSTLHRPLTTMRCACARASHSLQRCRLKLQPHLSNRACREITHLASKAMNLSIYSRRTQGRQIWKRIWTTATVTRVYLTKTHKTEISSSLKFRHYSLVKIHQFWTRKLCFWRTMSLQRPLKRNVEWLKVTQPTLTRESFAITTKTVYRLYLISSNPNRSRTWRSNGLRYAFLECSMAMVEPPVPTTCVTICTTSLYRMKISPSSLTRL